MQKITSTSNEKIKFLKTLKSKKGREESGTYLLEGKRAVLDAVKHNVKFARLLVQEGYELDFEPDCEVLEVSRHVLEALSEVSAPEGIIAQAVMQDLSFDASKIEGLVVFLDRLQDAGNVGTIIRTCDAAGVGAVVLSPNCVEVFNPKTIRATMSSIFNVPVMVAEDSIKALESLKGSGYTVYSAALGGENFYSVDKIDKNKSCIVIGNEGNGICDEILEISDKIIELPMRGGAESLNAAIALGVLVYGFMFRN